MPLLAAGWSVVAACSLIAACSWGLGFLRPGHYLEALHRLHGWLTSLISTAIAVTTWSGRFGVASAAIQIGVALGPGLVGVLRDATGGYAIAIGVLAALDAPAVVGVLWGLRTGPPFDSPTPTR